MIEALVVPQQSGSSSTTVSVTASGDPRIDGLLSGLRWSGPISYSDPDSPSDYQSGYSYDSDGDGISLLNEGFSRLTANQRMAAHFALNGEVLTQPAGSVCFSVEGFTNLGITYAGSGSGAGTLRLANSTDPGTAYTWCPDNSVYGGDAWFGPSGAAPMTGNYDWHTMLHELGHALGLKHGNEGGGPGNTALPSDVDSLEYTVMTYRSYIGASGYYYNSMDSGPQTFMMLDIAALQYMYGADYTTNSGDTVYTWNTAGESYIDGKLALDPSGNKIFSTIWDGGGRDVYDLSNYTTDLRIDLQPGQSSTFSTTQLAYLGGGPNGGYARGNVFNSLLYNGDTRSLIENVICGSGNDVVSGNAAANTLKGGSGNDILDGKTGADRMEGGANNDTYYVDNASDIVSEEASPGIDAGGADLINSSVSYSLGAYVEKLTLLGTGAINGTGNTLGNRLTGNGSANILKGLAGNDILNGKAGADRMEGGANDDTYYVDNISDVVSEEAAPGVDAGGTDLINSSVSRTLGAYVENLTLLGTGAINGTGNTLANKLTGNSGANMLDASAGNDWLYGKGGNDTLAGGMGTDNFVFDTSLNGLSNVDRIMDFSVVDDTIRLENAVFTAFATAGTLASGAFRIGAAAADLDDRIIYNSGTGALIYDSNGNVSGGAVQFASLSTALGLTNNDFMIA